MNKRTIKLGLALIVLVVSIIVMLGWFLDISVLKSILPGWVSMKFITALSFFFSAILLAILSKEKKGELEEFLILVISSPILNPSLTFS
jgi:ABC-type multidrug transport system permease subunit